jgi:hypothetical protein
MESEKSVLGQHKRARSQSAPPYIIWTSVLIIAASESQNMSVRYYKHGAPACGPQSRFRRLVLRFTPRDRDVDLTGVFFEAGSIPSSSSPPSSPAVPCWWTSESLVRLRLLREEVSLLGAGPEAMLSKVPERAASSSARAGRLRVWSLAHIAACLMRLCFLRAPL